jgi:oligo-1,6-glucosidase
MEPFQSLDINLSGQFAFTTSESDGKPLATTSEHPNWWKTGTCYQIWPASFKDSNGDGLGDIPGILSKLDYVHDLGIDIIWLSPMYASPQIDMGYDISDYNAVYPRYGTMEDMDLLIKGVHDRGMKIILDLVINHTSDQHHWFQDSKKTKTGKYADWYIWKDPKILEDGTKAPPNNWGAFFGGSAWEYVESRDQYYLHLFARQMPDLNWENEETRMGIHESALRFWFRKGVNGFRIDTCALYSKVQTYPDGPIGGRSKPYGDPSEFVSGGPRIHEFYREMRKEVLDDFGDPMMVGELGALPIEQILKYISSDRHEISMVFDFSLVTLGGAMKMPWHEIGSWTLPELKMALKKTQDLVANTKAWSTVFAENHDIPRSISRWGTTDPRMRDRAAKMLAILFGTLSGTLFLYQGQEIGMTNIDPDTWDISDCQDVATLNYWDEMKRQYPGDKEMLHKVWLAICKYSRDNARTPVQWSGEAHAGFTTGKPWMRVNDNYEEINVAKQMDDDQSIRSFWKRILKLRKVHADLFVQGRYHVHYQEAPHTITFEKKAASGKVALVMLNFTPEYQRVEIPPLLEKRKLEAVIANVPIPGHHLSPWEGRVYIER